jgi:hypothetical protein
VTETKDVPKDKEVVATTQIELPPVRFEIRNYDTEEVVAAFDVVFDDTRPWQILSSIGSAFHAVSKATPVVILNLPLGPDGSLATAELVTPEAAAAKKAEAAEEKAAKEEAEKEAKAEVKK